MTELEVNDQSKYLVKTPQFEGPLDLLLELIEKRKLFVNELSLAQVTDDYVQHVRNMTQINVGSTAHFIVIAATLILIKSRSLLPNIELSPDEKKEIVNLEYRLRVYQAIKEVSTLVKQSFGRNVIYMSPDRDWSTPVFSPDSQITTDRMRQGLLDVLANMPKKEFLPEVTVKKVITIEEMIDSLSNRIQKAMREGAKISFKQFAASAGTPEEVKEAKVYVIVSFLAMLELVREGLMDCMQQNNFEDIEMYGINN